MFCRNCGKEIDDNAYVCIHCGAKVDNQLNESGTNGMAVAGFVCSFFIPLLGWIFGGIGLSQANKREDGKGKGFSISAIIISCITFLINLIIIISAL